MVTAKKNGVVFSGALGVDVQSKREATHRALTTSHSLLTYLRIEQEEYFNVFFCAFVGLVGFWENIWQKPTVLSAKWKTRNLQKMKQTGSCRQDDMAFICGTDFVTVVSE